VNRIKKDLEGRSKKLKKSKVFEKPHGKKRRKKRKKRRIPQVSGWKTWNLKKKETSRPPASNNAKIEKRRGEGGAAEKKEGIFNQ